MANKSILDRLVQLENQRRFLNWFATARFYASLTVDELETFARDGKLPDPLPNRPSSLDKLDRKTLIRRWENDERIFGRRSHEELVFYTENGLWPEQRGGFHYSMQEGRLAVEWRSEPPEGGTTPDTTTQEPGT